MLREVAITLCFTSVVVLGYAQQTEDLKTVESRLTALEKSWGRMPKISGFINMRYRWDDINNENSFDIRRARIDFKGDITSKLDYRLQVEFAGTPKVLDAYIRWKVDRRFNLQAGEFKIPFTIENQYGPTTLETAENATVISRLCDYSDVSGISSNGRDIGVGAYGGFVHRDGYDLISYSVGVFNGNGINVSDNNRAKDFSGIVELHPVKSLTLAVYHYNGTVGKQGETKRRIRTGGGVRYDNSKLLLRSEYIAGTTGDMDSRGWYAVAGFYVTHKWQPVVRYDDFQGNTLMPETHERSYLAGMNFFPNKWLRLQLNYTRKHIETKGNFNMISTQFFAVF